VRELAQPGIQDPDIIPLLHHSNRPVLFTHNQDYFKRALIHPAYCLVWLDLYDGDAAIFIQRFLRHAAFASHRKRMGKVIRLHPQRINFWEKGQTALQTIKWQADP
jgi:hypothetical protein